MLHSEFPSDETLAAFIDGRVDGETRRRVIEHMAECPECYSVFLAATEMRGTAAGAVVPFPRRRALGIGLVAAAAVAAVVLLLTPTGERLISRPKSGLAALAEAAPPQRNIEGRLTGFPYRPLAPVTRGPGDQNAAKNPENWKLLSVAARVQEEAKKNPTVESLHALGVLHLLLGNREQAVRTLEEALKKDTGETDISKAIQKSRDAKLLNDLSAAYYTTGSPRAVESSERAFALEHTSPAIGFNRALAISALGQSARAEAAWNDYLRLDDHSPWSSEARSRLAELRARKRAQKESWR
jgi:tetratricopeptide (TPR) repeat protein